EIGCELREIALLVLQTGMHRAHQNPVGKDAVAQIKRREQVGVTAWHERRATTSQGGRHNARATRGRQDGAACCLLNWCYQCVKVATLRACKLRRSVSRLGAAPRTIPLSCSTAITAFIRSNMMKKNLLGCALLGVLGVAHAAVAQEFDDRWYVSGTV